jgi:hypothetical protein
MSLARSKELLLFTINGAFVQATPVDELACWSLWEDERGLDFAAVAFLNQKVFAFELKMMNLGLPLIRLQKPATSLVALTRNGFKALIAITLDGVVEISPLK